VADAANTKPELCPVCRRVRPAPCKEAYTMERAVMLVAKGLCMCPPVTANPPRLEPADLGAAITVPAPPAARSAPPPDVAPK